MSTPYVPNSAMVYFFQQEIEPVIMPLFSGKHHLPEIQRLYDENMAMVRERYGITSLDTTLSDISPKDTVGNDGILPFGCSVKEGKPNMTLFVPEILKMFQDMQRAGIFPFYQGFESRLIAGLMHEMDHLALGRAENLDPIKNMDDERVVHARTANNTLRTLFEVYKWPLSGSDKDRYNTWCQCGFNADSQQWTDFIAGMYRSLKRA